MAGMADESVRALLRAFNQVATEVAAEAAAKAAPEGTAPAAAEPAEPPCDPWQHALGMEAGLTVLLDEYLCGCRNLAAKTAAKELLECLRPAKRTQGSQAGSAAPARVPPPPPVPLTLDAAEVARVARDLLAPMFDVADPEAVVRRMCADRAEWNPDDDPLTAVEAFLGTIRAACRAGAAVAGSAALYVELVLGDDVCWWPNDIDLWVDRPADGARVLSALCAPGTPVDAGHRDKVEPFDGTWPMCNGTRVERHMTTYPGASMVCSVRMGVPDRFDAGETLGGAFFGGLGQRVQVISQDVPVDAAGCQCAGAEQACSACLKRRPRVGTLNFESGSIWPPGEPWKRFDLDVAAVGIRAAAGAAAGSADRLEIVRCCGDPRSKTVRVRPHALWTIERDGPEAVDTDLMEHVIRRLLKYHQRGWTEVVVPNSTVVNGCDVATPHDVLAHFDRAIDRMQRPKRKRSD
jgi:hypothetical protein